MKSRHSSWTNHDRLPDGGFALSSSERKRLRKLTDKESRSEQEWYEIQYMLKDISLFSIRPMDERLSKKRCPHGVYQIRRWFKLCLIAFTSPEACMDYAIQYELPKVYEAFSIFTFPYSDLVDLADEIHGQLLIDPLWKHGSRFLLYDSKSEMLRNVITL